MEDKLKSFLDKSAAILLIVCAIGLIVLACNCFSSKRPQTHRIILTVSPDSVYEDRQFCYYTDSLINVINKHEHVIADRYEAMLEDRADTQKYWSIAGILVSIIIGIAGFFGFKTIKDIELDCKETAKSIATTTSKDSVQKYLNAHLKKEVKEASDIYFGNQEQHVSNMVNDAVAKDLQGCFDKLDELTGEMEGIEERLDKMEQFINVDGKTNASAQSDRNAPPTSSSASGEIDLFG